MDPALKDIMYVVLWTLVTLFGTIVGSAVLVFKMMKSTLESVQSRLALCEQRHKDTDDRLRKAVGTCPVTNQPCPLRNMYP